MSHRVKFDLNRASQIFKMQILSFFLASGFSQVFQSCKSIKKQISITPDQFGVRNSNFDRHSVFEGLSLGGKWRVHLSEEQAEYNPIWLKNGQNANILLLKHLFHYLRGFSYNISMNH